MAFVDYYKILGVDKNIPQSDVKKAYLKRAKLFHPDLHPDDPKAKAKFQALNEAYEVINDPEKRRKYDQYGEHWRDAEAYEQAGGGTGGGFGSSPFDGIDLGAFREGGFSSFFESMFGRMGGAHSTARANNNLTATVKIDMYTALLGGEILLALDNGSKLKLKVKPVTQNGTKVKIKGKGRLGAHGAAGDLIVTYHVVLPDHLSERQRQLLQEMRNSS